MFEDTLSEFISKQKKKKILFKKESFQKHA